MKSKGPIKAAPEGLERSFGVGGNFTGNSFVIGGDATGNAFGDGSSVDNHSVNIAGNVTNSQVAQNLINSSNLIQREPPGEKKDLLDQLRKEVATLIEHLPADKADEAPQVAENLEMLVKQATSEKPNRKWYSVSAEGLLEASKWTKDFAGNIFGTVGQVGKLIWPDFSLPGEK